MTSVQNDGARHIFVTKGDANQTEDPYLTSEEDVIGKVICISYPLGVAVHLLSNPLIFIPLILLPLFFILIYNLIYSVKVTKGIIREEEEAAVRGAVEAIRKKRAEEEEEKNDSKSK